MTFTYTFHFWHLLPAFFALVGLGLLVKGARVYKDSDFEGVFTGGLGCCLLLVAAAFIAGRCSP